MKRRHLFSIISLIHILITVPFVLSAQGENNNWHFGRKMGIDFNQNPPQLFESNMQTLESCSSVSDASGNLLFYTMGARIWDRNGNEMPNTTGLLGNGPIFLSKPLGSSGYGVVIIPNPANSNQYYVFSGDAIEDATYKLYYSLVDMTLNAGLGDVVPSVKNVLLMTNVSEFMSSTHGGDCKSYWLLARTSDSVSREFYVFKIDETGVAATPVITLPPPIAICNQTYTSFAPDGITMASCGSKLVLSKFNNLTGEVYDFVGIDSVPEGAIAFSPDGTKLYVSSGYTGVQQVNLSALPNTSAVAASVININSGDNIYTNYHDLRLAPNGKIYILRDTSAAGFHINISVINNPDVAGTGCNFTPAVFALPAPWLPAAPYDRFFSLGNPVVMNLPADTVYHPAKDTLVCGSNTLQLQSSNEDATIFEWSTRATTATINVSQAGSYWIRAFNNCSMTTDTFNVQFAHIDIDLGSDTAICAGNSMVLDAYDPEISNYQWSDGSDHATLQVSQAGTYYVSGSFNGCEVSDTIVISVIQPELFIVENDTIICNGQRLVLHALANPASTYAWNNGDNDDQTLADTAGTYIVTATNKCGTYKDSVNIQVQDCNCRIFIPNVFSPNGDGKNDAFGVRLACQPSEFSLSIYNRYGQRVFQGKSSTVLWDGTFNGQLMDAGTYFYYLTFKGPTGKEAEKKGDILLIR